MAGGSITIPAAKAGVAVPAPWRGLPQGPPGGGRAAWHVLSCRAASCPLQAGAAHAMPQAPQQGQGCPWGWPAEGRRGGCCPNPGTVSIQVRPPEGFVTFPGWQGRGRGGTASPWQARRHLLFIEHLGMLRSEAPHKHEMSLQRI